MNTYVHEYVSKSKRSRTVYLPVLAQRLQEFHSTAISRFFTYRGGVWNALTAISEGTLYIIAKVSTVFLKKQLQDHFKVGYLPS